MGKAFFIKSSSDVGALRGMGAVKWSTFINYINRYDGDNVSGTRSNHYYGVTNNGVTHFSREIDGFGGEYIPHEYTIDYWYNNVFLRSFKNIGFCVENKSYSQTSVMGALDGETLYTIRNNDRLKWATYINLLNHKYGARFSGDSTNWFYGITQEGRVEYNDDSFGALIGLDDMFDLITGKKVLCDTPYITIEGESISTEQVVEVIPEDEEVVDYLGVVRRESDCVILHDDAPSHAGEYCLTNDARYCDYEDGYCLKSDAERVYEDGYFFSGNEGAYDIHWSEYNDCWVNSNHSNVYYGYCDGYDDEVWFIESKWVSAIQIDGDWYRDGDAARNQGYRYDDEEDEWISEEEYHERRFRGYNATYHSNERGNDFTGERPLRFDPEVARFTIGFEVEKEDDDAYLIPFYQLYNRTGWVKENDASLNGENGYELVSPAFDLFDDLIDREIENDDELQQLINADGTSNCGGHINLGSTVHSTEELFELLAGFFPLFYSIYEHRIDRNYSKAKKKHDYYAKDKYSAIFIKDRVLEFRIPSRVKNVQNLLWRRDLMRIMCSSIKSEKIKALNGVHYKPVTELDVLKMLINPSSKLYKHMRKVFSHELMIKKVEKFVTYSGQFNNTYLPQIIRSEFPTDNINNNVEHDQDGMGA